MPIDCASPPCERVLPASTIINVFADTPIEANDDCSTNLIYLLDDAGVVNTASNSAAWLSTTSRSRVVSSVDEVKLHFTACSRVYYELTTFFGFKFGALKRPRSIVLVYFDSSSETMLDALNEFYQCNQCFYTLTHVAYDRNNAAIADSEAQLELAEWASAFDTRVVLPSINIEAAINVGDEQSNAYKSKQVSHANAVYQLLNEECVPVLDAQCQPTDTLRNVWGVQHLVLAGVISSVSSNADTYQYNTKFKPLGGEQLSGVTTAQLSQSETYIAIGSNPILGGVQANAAHHFNVYHNVAGKRFLMEGLTATGDFIDDMAQRRYVRDRLNNDLMALLVDTQDVSMTDLNQLKGAITSAIRRFIKQGIISDKPNAIDKSQFNDIYLQGNGWVLRKAPTQQSNIASRITPNFTLCYVRDGGTNYISIGLCAGTLGAIN